MHEDGWEKKFTENGISLGAYLLSERQKKGYSLARIAQETRVRLEILESIEKEAWEKLPPPAFVKGFLISYARALDLEEKQVLDMYSMAGHSPKPLKPLARTTKTGRGFYLFVIPLLVVLAGAMYFLGKDFFPGSDKWMERFFPGDEETARSIDPPEEKKSSPYEPKLIQESLSEDQYQQDLKYEIPGQEMISDHKEPLQETEADNSPPSDSLKTPSDAKEQTKEGDLILKAKARKRTWLRIIADGGEPKEYMLPPGSERQFSARERFELLIGNAGGIALELNEEKMDNLGALGEVLRITLPDDMKKRGETH
jgi:cytoskeletal protein RodZ